VVVRPIGDGEDSAGVHPVMTGPNYFNDSPRNY